MADSPVLYVYYRPDNDDAYPGVPNRHITEADWARFSPSQRRTVEQATTQEGYTRRKVWVHRDLVDETEQERADREAAEQAAREAYERGQSIVRWREFEKMVPGPGEVIVGSEDGPVAVDASTVGGEVDPALVAERVTEELAERDILEGGDILEDDIAFAVVDEDGRRTWLEAGMDGGLTDYAAGKIGEHITGAVDADMTADGLSFAVVDEDDRRTWIEADAEGKPTARALSLISNGLSITTETTLTFPVDDWAHWGDSLTAGGSSGDWPAKLAVLTGRNHYNGGWGGQGASQIAARQGGVPARVTLAGNQIPASGAVAVTSITRTPLSNGGSRLVTIAGIEGTLAQDGSGNLTFTRSVAGDAVTTGGLEYVTPWHGSAYRDRHVTIWAGRNDVLYNPVEPVVQSIRQMIDYLTPSVRRVIVMEIPPSSNDTIGSPTRATLDAANAAIKAAFPEYWLDIATWLRTSDAATAAGITFTADDNDDIASGITPRSFRSDVIHYNTAGGTAIAARVYQEAQLRGWIA